MGTLTEKGVTLFEIGRHRSHLCTVGGDANPGLVTGAGEGEDQLGIALSRHIRRQVELDLPGPRLRLFADWVIAGLSVIPISRRLADADGVDQWVGEVEGEALVQVRHEVVVAMEELSRIPVGFADLPG